MTDTSSVGESSPEPTENAEQTEAKTETKTEGSERVDFTPEQQKRFDTIYGKLKHQEKELQEYKSVAKQQFDAIEQLRQSQGQIVNYLQEGDFGKAESMLKAQRKEAYDRGDLPSVDDINDKLSDIKIQKKLSEIHAKQTPNQRQTQNFNADDAITKAVNSGTISKSDAEVYRAWANEKDEYGDLKRPWVNEVDSRNRAASIEGAAVFNNPTYANKAFADKLKEIDSRMGVINRSNGESNVLSSGNLTRAAKTNTIKLTPYQETVAVKTKFAGPGKSSQDHIEAYRSQVAAIKGGRK